MRKWLRKIVWSREDEFSRSLGYETWTELMENTFHIFFIPTDNETEWRATQLPDGNWAVWNDEGQTPYSFTLFNTWQEAIRFLRNLFEQNAYPEQNWYPEGFDQTQDVYSELPDKAKKF